MGALTELLGKQRHTVLLEEPTVRVEGRIDDAPRAMVLLAVDFAAYGSSWAPPLGWGVFLFTTFFYGMIGASITTGKP